MTPRPVAGSIVHFFATSETYDYLRSDRQTTEILVPRTSPLAAIVCYARPSGEFWRLNIRVFGADAFSGESFVGIPLLGDDDQPDRPGKMYCRWPEKT